MIIRHWLPVVWLFVALVGGCQTPSGLSVSLSDDLDVISSVEEIPFIDKGARAKPHGNPRGLYSDKFPDTVLIDHRGEKHRFYSDLVKDRMAVIQFFYTTCDGI